jgi:hypothetical protein
MSRFSEPPHPDFQAINASLAFDLERVAAALSTVLGRA